MKLPRFSLLSFVAMTLMAAVLLGVNLHDRRNHVPWKWDSRGWPWSVHVWPDTGASISVWDFFERYPPESTDTPNTTDPLAIEASRYVWWQGQVVWWRAEFGSHPGSSPVDWTYGVAGNAAVALALIIAAGVLVEFLVRRGRPFLSRPALSIGLAIFLLFVALNVYAGHSALTRWEFNSENLHHFNGWPLPMVHMTLLVPQTDLVDLQSIYGTVDDLFKPGKYFGPRIDWHDGVFTNAMAALGLAVLGGGIVEFIVRRRERRA